MRNGILLIGVAEPRPEPQGCYLQWGSTDPNGSDKPRSPLFVKTYASGASAAFRMDDRSRISVVPR